MYDLKHRKVQRQVIAAELNVTPTHLSRTLTAMGFEGEKSPEVARRKAATLLFTTRQEHRHKVALQLDKGTINLKLAAEQSNCSERTMLRHLAKVRAEQS